MGASSWIALASFAAFIFVQTAVACLAIGGLFARLNALERRPPDDCKAELAALDATLKALKEAMDKIEEATAERIKGLEHTMRNLMMSGPPSRRRSSGGS